MKTILIIIVMHSTAAVTAVEFDDAPSCESAARAVRMAENAKTFCVPKATPKIEDRVQ